MRIEGTYEHLQM